MTAAEAQAQFTMWSMVAAPLIIGSDPRTFSPSTIAMLSNPEAVAIDQDPAGVQGTRLATEGSGQVWVKPLANGDKAVALLNTGSTPLTISITANAVGLPDASTYNLRNVWTHTTTETAGRIAANVAPDSALLLRVSPGSAGQGNPPAVVTSGPDTPRAYPGSDLRLAVPGSPMTVTASVENDGRTPIDNTKMTLGVAAGWRVAPSATDSAGVLPTGHSATGTWTVTPTRGALPGLYNLNVQTSYTWSGRGAGSASVFSSRRCRCPSRRRPARPI
jgi:alpha-galactosidase